MTVTICGSGINTLPMYAIISRGSNPDSSRIGWSTIWKLRVMPKVKIFIWKLAQGKIPTSAFLYHVNIGPVNYYPLCGLWEETSDHLLWNCCKVIHCWHELISKLDFNTDITYSLRSGNWLLEQDFGKVSKLWFKL